MLPLTRILGLATACAFVALTQSASPLVPKDSAQNDPRASILPIQVGFSRQPTQRLWRYAPPQAQLLGPPSSAPAFFLRGMSLAHFRKMGTAFQNDPSWHNMFHQVSAPLFASFVSKEAK